jgi:hypothetical protein
MRGSGSILGAEEATVAADYVAGVEAAADCLISQVDAATYVAAVKSAGDMGLAVPGILARQNLDTMRNCGRLGGTPRGSGSYPFCPS